MTQEKVRRILVGATDPRLTQLSPTVLLIFLTTGIHLLSSIDLGSSELLVRSQVAALSIIPALVFIKIAHTISDRTSIPRTPFVLLAYVVGGITRGWILESTLRELDVIAAGTGGYRIASGAVITSFSAMTLSYTWSTLADARDRYIELHSEMLTLQETLSKLEHDNQATEVSDTLALGQRLTDELGRLAQIDTATQRRQLERLVNDVVRPLSRNLAPMWSRLDQESIAVTEVSWRGFWRLIDPLRHLPSPGLLVIGMAISVTPPVVALYGWRTALEVASIVASTLLVSMYAMYPIFRRVLDTHTPRIQGLGITIGFLVIAIPPAFATTIALSGTPDPQAYFIPGIVTLPVLAWVMLIGNTALHYASTLFDDLQSTRDQLKWSVARLNVLSWYHRGLISRLLHGPIQNTLQVALLEIRASDDESDNMSVINSAIRRIDEAIHDAKNPTASTKDALATMESALNSWRSIAEIQRRFDAPSESALLKDPAGCAVFTDIVMEACSNAIRHGDASRLEISYELIPSGIALTVTDNGTWDVTSSSVGLGTEVMTACSVAMERLRTSDGNRLRLELPLSDHIPAAQPQ